jgi:hypothetical protein
VSAVVRDPGIASGPYRILARSDGLIALCDWRKPLGMMTIKCFSSEAAAKDWMMKLVAKEKG